MPTELSSAILPNETFQNYLIKLYIMIKPDQYFKFDYKNTYMINRRQSRIKCNMGTMNP